MKLNLALIALTLSSSLFAQTFDDNPARDKRIETLIKSNAVSKCADGSPKEYIDGGYLNHLKIDRPYIAKTDQQVFVVITPKPEGNKVGIYYCPVKNIYLQNGQKKSVNVPLDFVNYNLGQLRKSDYCDFSDILSGSVDLTFRGNRPVRLNLRPIMQTEAEKKEYKKLCSDKKQSVKVQDVVCEPEVKTKTSELTEQVSDTLKKKYYCDMRDIISGQMLLGAGIRVNVDEVNKKAELASISVYPGAQEKVDGVMKLQEGTSKYELKSENHKSSFELLDANAGILTQVYTANGKTSTQAFSCKVQ